MPGTAQAALVFLLVVVPGFLAMAGYRLGRAVPDHPEGLVATARVLTVSAFITVVAWKLGGRDLYKHVHAGTALTSHEGETYRFAVALLMAPGVVGFLLGQGVDYATHLAWRARSRLPVATRESEREEPMRPRLWRKALTAPVDRFLHDGPATWDRTWKHIRRTEPYVYVRVTTKGGREIVGTVADDSRIALSPQPRDLYIQEILRPAADGTLYPTKFGLGAFVAGSEIETVEWVSHEGVVRSA